mgnify:CR=1 FL=1
MDDREMLELAANAAGIGPVLGFADCALVIGPRRYQRYWNPLTDDGDALRLAVAVDISARWHSVLNQAIARSPSLSEFVENGEDHGGDRYAATRRAIVSAAAEIGRSMP